MLLAIWTLALVKIMASSANVICGLLHSLLATHIQSVHQLSYQDVKVYKLLLALWASNEYLAGPVGQQMIPCMQGII